MLFDSTFFYKAFVGKDSLLCKNDIIEKVVNLTFVGTNQLSKIFDSNT